MINIFNLEFEGGCTVSFTMNAFNEGGRFIRIFGTKAEVVASMEKNEIDVFSFDTSEHTIYDTGKTDSSMVGGHGGGDTGIMADLVKYFNNETPSKSACSLRTSYLNHITTFAAEESKVKNIIVDVNTYSEEI